MVEIETSVHVSSNPESVWHMLLATPRLPIFPAVALRHRVHLLRYPNAQPRTLLRSGQRLTYELEEGTVIESVVGCDPIHSISLHIVGGSLNDAQWMSNVRDLFTIVPNGTGTILTRNTHFDRGPRLTRSSMVASIKRTIRRLQFQFLSDVKIRAEAQRHLSNLR